MSRPAAHATRAHLPADPHAPQPGAPQSDVPQPHTAASYGSAYDQDLLRQRLRESEDTLRAIRLGETDALLVHGPDGPRVYTLVTADQSYRTLVEQMREAALILSEEGTILYCNARLGVLIGGPAPLARALADLAVPEDREAVAAMLARAGSGDAHGEVRLARSDGKAVSVNLSVSQLRSGTFTGLAAVATDLTEQKRRERAVERERLTNAVLEFAGTAILVCDEAGRIVRGNHAALVLCGEPVIGCNFADALPIGVTYDQLRESKEEAREVKLCRPHQAELCLLVSARRIGNGAPEDGWWVVTLADLTERERLREAEQRARDRLQGLQEVTAGLSAAASPDQVATVMVGAGRSCLGATAGMVALLTDDGCALRIVAAAGYPESLIEQCSSFAADAEGAIALALRSQQITPFASSAERLRRFGGSGPIGLEAGLVAPLVIDGRNLGVLTFSYAAEHAWANEELALTAALAQQCAQALERAQLYASEHAARAAAEEANRTKSDFLNVMSHELRTPLNSVLGYADLLLMEVKGSLTESQKLPVERIRASALHQLSLVEEILGYARLEAGSEHLRLTAVDVGQLVRDVAEFIGPEASRRSIAITVDLAQDAELKLISDPCKLRQILLNLAANGMKFTRAGSVRLAAAWDADGWLCVHVQDTGPGIPQEDLPRIWEPFTQLDSSATREFGGAGLGLAIVRRLVEFVGGRITVDSALGQGSTFTVRLPKKPPL
jgi:PAS domain S-box-containing protein